VVGSGDPLPPWKGGSEFGVLSFDLGCGRSGIGFIRIDTYIKGTIKEHQRRVANCER
jgi:hypothetical protein